MSEHLNWMRDDLINQVLVYNYQFTMFRKWNKVEVKKKCKELERVKKKKKTQIQGSQVNISYKSKSTYQGMKYQNEFLFCQKE